MKFVVFKIDKTTSKVLNEEENGQCKNEQFESFERYSSPLAGIYLVKVNNRNTGTRCECQWRRSGVYIVNFKYIFTPCSSVSIVNFEHVIARWAYYERLLSFFS